MNPKIIALFYLRDPKSGQFLNYNAETFTESKAYAWKGTVEQYQRLMKKFTAISHLKLVSISDFL